MKEKLEVIRDITPEMECKLRSKLVPLPTQEELRALLDYNPDSGLLFWKEKDITQFKSTPRGVAQYKRWNTCFVGREAFCIINGAGRKRGTINYKTYFTHRIIWKLVHNEEPVQIDHINGNPLDNRICNLRAATPLTNGHNIRISKRNKSGTLGVHWVKNDKRWVAKISIRHKNICLGLFKNKEDAISARKKAEADSGLHILSKAVINAIKGI